MANLTSLANVQQALGLGTLTGDDMFIGTLVAQASSLIEHYYARTFSDSLGTLYLNACPPHAFGHRLYFMTDVLGVYSVVNGNGDVIPATDYQLLPLNASPKTGMELKVGTGRYWTWTTDPVGAITIAGTLGYCTSSNIPADVVYVATKLAALLYQNRDNKGEIVRFADSSVQVPVNVIPDIIRILETTRYNVDLPAF